MDLNSVNITATQVAKNYFSAYVENGFIYSYSVYGERQQVGVTNVARVLTALGHPPESIKQAVNSLGAIAPTPQQTPNNQNISNEIRSFEERLKIYN